MLTRLKISGFKNLVDVEVRFGPFTCIAGPNGVGKSNLFDALRFLSALAQHPLTEAAKSVRDEEGRTSDVRSLFQRQGASYAKKMYFDLDMIVPREGIDDLGQPAKAKTTLLNYRLVLGFKENDFDGQLQVEEEALTPIKRKSPNATPLFPHSQDWAGSVIMGQSNSDFISFNREQKIINRHQEGTSGRPLRISANSLQRTVLCSVNAAESPTALLAKREMMSWGMLQLEPSALRRPDSFDSPTSLGMDGSHLPATLYHLAKYRARNATDGSRDEEERIYREVASRLSDLLGDVARVWIDRDDKRALLTLMVEDREGTSHPARSLSDGTLRFLALAVLELDPRSFGILCLEEPENGIHPARIPSILKLLQEIAVDTEEAVDESNPLRQVIINTHSPGVVQEVPHDSLLVAESEEAKSDSGIYHRVTFTCLPQTWRHNSSVRPTAIGKLLAYLNPVLPTKNGGAISNGQTKYRVIDAIHQLSLFN